MIKETHAIISWLIPKICFCCHNEIIFPNISEEYMPNGFKNTTKHRCKRTAQHTNKYVSSDPNLQQSRSLKGEGYITHNTSICNHCKNKLPWQKNSLNQYAIKAYHNKIRSTLAVFFYKQPCNKLIQQLKNKHTYLANFFASLLYEKISYLYETQKLPEAILAVPLHPKNLRKRGYNQSLEIAKHLAKMLNIPLVSSSLVIRQKLGKKQANLTKKLRQFNTKNAFSLTGNIPYKHIAILDDVITTGATIDNLSKVLKSQHKSLHLDAWCVCQA